MSLQPIQRPVASAAGARAGPDAFLGAPDRDRLQPWMQVAGDFGDVLAASAMVLQLVVCWVCQFTGGAAMLLPLNCSAVAVTVGVEDRVVAVRDSAVMVSIVAEDHVVAASDGMVVVLRVVVAVVQSALHHVLESLEATANSVRPASHLHAPFYLLPLLSLFPRLSTLTPQTHTDHMIPDIFP